MRQGESELQMVQRHVYEGQGHIVRQRAIIERLRTGNLSVNLAEAILSEFEKVQRLHEDHLTRIG